MNIALIEVEEEDLEKIAVPFIMYGVYHKRHSKKLVAAWLLINDARKKLGDAYKKMEALEAANED